MTKPLNILFLFPDQHRFDWLGCAGDLNLNTPNLDVLAENGMRFTRCYTPSPVCSPARACLATGRRYTRAGVVNNGQNTPEDLPNYYRILRDAGYEVSGVGKFDLHKPDRDWGLDGTNKLLEYGFTRGCDSEGKGDAIHSFLNNDGAAKGPYMHHLSQRNLAETHVNMYHEDNGDYKGLCYSAITELPDNAYSDNWIGQNALNELDAFDTDKPWHLVVNWTGPHDPYDVTQSMHDAWHDIDFPGAHKNIDDDPDEILKRRQYYAAMIENIDRIVGELIAKIEERGELDRTLIIYSSDHGEMLGDHNRWAKGVWHEASSHVPLIVSGPGVEKGVVSDALVSVHDFAALFIEAAGAAKDSDMDAKSFWPVLRGEADKHRDHLAVGLSNWRMIVEGSLKYIEHKELGNMLYDLESDPTEDQNIVDSSGHASNVERYHALIEDEIPFPESE